MTVVNKLSGCAEKINRRKASFFPAVFRVQELQFSCFPFSGSVFRRIREYPATSTISAALDTVSCMPETASFENALRDRGIRYRGSANRLCKR